MIIVIIIITITIIIIMLCGEGWGSVRGGDSGKRAISMNPSGMKIWL